MKKYILFIVFSVSCLGLYSQISVNDFITKPMLQMPSFTALQKNQIRTTFNYEILPYSFLHSDVFTMCNEFNLKRINSGVSIAYENYSFNEYFQRNINLSYNYRQKLGKAVLIPAISYENIKYNVIEQYDSISSGSYTSGHSLLNSSVLLIYNNLNVGFGLKNLNKPTVNRYNYEYTYAIRYQLYTGYNFLTKNKFVDYLQLVVYNEYYKNNGTDNFYILSAGLNTKFRFLCLGFDINFSNIFPGETYLSPEKYDIFCGVKNENISFYYSMQKDISKLSGNNKAEHSFTLSANFDLLKSKH